MEGVVLGLGLAGALVAVLLAAWHAVPWSVGPVSRGSPSGREALLATLAAASGGKRVRVEPYSHGEEGGGIRLVVEGLCAQVTLRRRSAPAERSRSLVREPEPLTIATERVAGGLDTGDGELDAAIEALGPPERVHALLDAGTRTALRRLLGGSVRVGQVRLERGELHVEVPTDGFAREHPGLPQAAREAGEVSRLLAAPEPVRERLAANARHDPEAGVRLQNLLALARIRPRDAFVSAELRAAASDRDARVRLGAGIALDQEGRDVLMALATDDAVEDACSARAIEALAGGFPAAEARSALERACSDAGRAPRRPATLCACIEALGRHEGSEAALIAALALEHGEVRAAAARALGDVGTAAAILPLKEAAERHAGALSGAVRHAVARIQSRLTGSPGELSLAEEEPGRLSLTDDARGRVSLPNPARDDAG